MFMAKESDQTAFLQLEQSYSLPFFHPSNLPGTNTGKQDEVDQFLKPAPPNCEISYQTKNLFLKNSQSQLIRDLRVADKPIDAPQKGFLIFDRSGNQTRLFFSPSFSPENQILPTNTPSSANGPFGETANLDIPMKPTVQEKWDENNSTGGDDENEMLEDSEEIDALFYSDRDDEYDDDDDEVTSTGQSPSPIKEGYNKDEKLLDEQIEEVASSDDSPKRQKLLDGKYEISSRAISRVNYYDDDDFDTIKREKKVQIRRALKILETIIPGLTTKDPLSVIDEAIIYLKSMKTEAESLGVSYPGDDSVSFP